MNLTKYCRISICFEQKPSGIETVATVEKRTELTATTFLIAALSRIYWVTGTFNSVEMAKVQIGIQTIAQAAKAQSNLLIPSPKELRRSRCHPTAPAVWLNRSD
jgi:hypothetical protein